MDKVYVEVTPIPAGITIAKTIATIAKDVGAGYLLFQIGKWVKGKAEQLRKLSDELDLDE